jgi:ElaB/YqjD/DUF883 family membrane-anchored ribosome-binding protein
MAQLIEYPSACQKAILIGESSARGSDASSVDAKLEELVERSRALRQRSNEVIEQAQHVLQRTSDLIFTRDDA